MRQDGRQHGNQPYQHIIQKRAHDVQGPQAFEMTVSRHFGYGLWHAIDGTFLAVFLEQLDKIRLTLEFFH